jgi:anti-sigma-K factor RskA
MTDIHALTGAYVLNAVDDMHRARFDRHLAECPACAAEVAELTETIAGLTAVSAEAPPADLRTAVLARAAATPQLPRDTQRAPRRRASDWRRWLVAAAAVVALGGAGAVGYVIADHSPSGGTQATADTRRIAAVLAAPDARTHSVATGDGRVTVVTAASLNDGVAVLANLPSPGAGHSYQLWVIRDQTPRSVEVLPAGHIDATELIPGVRGAQAFGVSREPAGGSAKPSKPLVAQLPLR